MACILLHPHMIGKISDCQSELSVIVAAINHKTFFLVAVEQLSFDSDVLSNAVNKLLLCTSRLPGI